MPKCEVCGSIDFHSELVSEEFNINGEFHLVENIPATVCARCGEETFNRETTEQARNTLYKLPRFTRPTSKTSKGQSGLDPVDELEDNSQILNDLRTAFLDIKEGKTYPLSDFWKV